MKPTQKLHDLGQSLWVDNITRELLNSGTSSHRQPLRQSERQWLDMQATGWPAGRAFDLEQFPIPCEIAESYGRCRCRAASQSLGSRRRVESDLRCHGPLEMPCLRGLSLPWEYGQVASEHRRRDMRILIRSPLHPLTLFLG